MLPNDQCKWLQRSIPAYDIHNPDEIVYTVRSSRREYIVVYVFVDI